MNVNQLIENAPTQQPTIFVLVGLPGSGKSTWVESLRGRMEFVYLSTDTHLEDYAKTNGVSYNDAFSQFIGEADGKMKAMARQAFSDNANIVWDQTNLSTKKRAKILNQTPKNYRKVAVVFKVDDDELSKRLDNRYKETGKFISKSIIDTMRTTFQEPSTQEGFHEIRYI
jgi:predicted kinase